MSLRRFDVFPKLDNEFRVGTTAGGILSLCSLVAAIVLSYVEIYSYLHPPVRQRLSVDAVRPTELDGVTISSRSQPRFDVNLDVTFPEVPCYLLHIDVLDSITQLPLPLDVSGATFKRLNRNGDVIGSLGSDFMETGASAECGSCYVNGYDGCCKSCQDVLNAHKKKGLRPPVLSEVAQCKEVLERIKSMDGEGCRYVGSFRVVRFASEFHIAPGISWAEEGWHVHDMRPFGKGLFDLNLTHTVNRLQFVDSDKKMPLDGFTNVQDKMGAWRVVYTADILGENFSVSRFNMYNTSKYMGVCWNYDVSPITATTYLDKEPLLHLLTRLLTVVGGVLGIFRFVDQMMFYSSKKDDSEKMQ